jgi:AcrR family transcriptional regulator
MAQGLSASTRERILAAAVAIIDERGEAALRLMDVAAAAGITLSLITHHFGTRDNLVAEAHMVRFEGLYQRDTERIAALAETSLDATGFREALADLTAEVLDRERDIIRLRRAVSVGAAHGRPDLHAQLGDTAAGLLDEFERVIRRAQSAGLIREDLSPRALATFVHAYSFGMVIADLDQRPVPREEIAAVIDVFAAAVLAT